MSELTPNTSVRLLNGNSCVVKKELARGGQGIVYVVTYQGKDYALKWYTQKCTTAFYDNLINNVKSGSPASNFLWPLAVTEMQNGSYGYVMELRPSEYVDMCQFLLHKAVFASVEAQIKACIQICDAFQKLHIRGLSYQDMNDGNFFINPKNGEVLICDNDNVAPDGTNLGILGKAGYMAPEIVEGKSKPNKYSDFYSMAVCLFILIYMNRPFEGAKFASCPCDSTPENTKKLFGFESVFIMDPNDSSNRPVKGLHNNVIKLWPMYPSLLAEAFQKTFSHESNNKPTERLMDKQWRNILLQIRSILAPCPSCGNKTFFGIKGQHKGCLYCGKGLENYNVLKVGRFEIPLVKGQKIYDCQLTDNTDLDIVSGEVVEKSGEIGIVNNSKYSWTVVLQDGVRAVESGRGLPAKKGYELKFGNNGNSGKIE